MANKPNPFKTVSDAKRRESPFAKVQRERRNRGVDWSRVDHGLLTLATAATVLAGATIVVSSAMGGLGVTVRIWNGDDKWVEYAGNAAELNTLMTVVAEHFESPAEDLRMLLGMGGQSADDAEEQA